MKLKPDSKVADQFAKAAANFHGEQDVRPPAPGFTKASSTAMPLDDWMKLPGAERTKQARAMSAEMVKSARRQLEKPHLAALAKKWDGVSARHTLDSEEFGEQLRFTERDRHAVLADVYKRASRALKAEEVVDAD